MTSEKVPEAGFSRNTQHLIEPLQPRPQSGATCWTGVGQYLKESQAPFPPEFLNSPPSCPLHGSGFPRTRALERLYHQGWIAQPLIYLDSSDPLLQSVFSLSAYPCTPLQPPLDLSVYYSNSICQQASHSAQNIQALVRLSEVFGSKSFPSLTCTRPGDASPVQPMC